MSSWLINTDKTINKWCRQMGLYCPMATTNGYCQVTACKYMAEPMSICNNENAAMPYKTPKVNWTVNGYIPIEWLKTKTIGELCELLEDWEKENEQV